MIRLATPDDMDHMLRIAKAKYPSFDEAHSLAWGHKAILSPNFCWVVGEQSFGVAAVSAPFYSPASIKGVMLLLASEGSIFETCSILRFMIRWAIKDRGAVSFHFGEDTGANLEPLAKRVRAATDRKSYVVTANGQKF